MSSEEDRSSRSNSRLRLGSIRNTTIKSKAIKRSKSDMADQSVAFMGVRVPQSDQQQAQLLEVLKRKYEENISVSPDSLG